MLHRNELASPKANGSVGKGFLEVETPLFASMLVQPQAAEEEDDVEVPATPTLPSPTNAPSPPPQDPINTPPQAQPATPSSPSQEQPTETFTSSDVSTSKASKDEGSGENGDTGFVFGDVQSNKDGSLNIESFAKKRVEDRELQINFTPQCVLKKSDGLRRIAISEEDIRKNEEGIKDVLKSGSWMVNNVPLILNVWEVRIWLDKVFNGVGKPTLMDKLTKERCLKKVRKLDFARVLVEVSASDVFPDFLEIKYPKLEIATKAIKDAMKSGDNMFIKTNDKKLDEDGFVTVRRKSKANLTQSNYKEFVLKNRNFYGVVGGKSFVENEKGRVSSALGSYKNFGLVQKPPLSSRYNENFKPRVLKPPLSSRYNENFKPRVLVRRSSSLNKEKGDVNENVPVTNSFQAFEDMVDKEEAFNEVVNEEYDKIIQTQSKSENVKGLNNDSSKKQVMDLRRMNRNVPGVSMYSVMSKLKMLKKPLGKMKYAQGDLSKNTMKFKEELSRIQSDMDVDRNFFSGADVSEQFVKHFENVLGRKVEVNPITEPNHLFVNNLSQVDADCIVSPVLDEEIEAYLFSIEDDKATGPDGFSSKFFKFAWSIMGLDFTKAIKDFLAMHLTLSSSFKGSLQSALMLTLISKFCLQ
nr:hypothetical protein [Tanacetum cinerariifolium]